MTEYSSAIALAKRLITKKGRSNVSVYRPAVGTVTDADRPWKPDATVGTTADTLIASGLHVVFLDNRQARGAQGQFGFDIFLRARMEMLDSLMPGATAIAYLVPEELGATRLEAGDLMVSGTHRYAVMRCDPLEPGNELIMFAAQIKE